MSGTTANIRQARMRVEQAKRQVSSTLGTLQYRLKPTTIVNNAWEGVREKSGEVAGDAIEAVKRRPAAASGVLAGIALFLARDSLWHVAAGLFSRKEDEDEGVIRADLDNHENYDLTAPTVPRSVTEGANA